MIFKPAWALNASTSALLWRMISSIGRSNWKFTGLTLNLALASASGLMSCSFMRLLVLVCFSFHRRACLLGSQTTNRFSTIQGTFPLVDWGILFIAVSSFLPPSAWIRGGQLFHRETDAEVFGLVHVDRGCMPNYVFVGGAGVFVDMAMIYLLASPSLFASRMAHSNEA